MEKIYIQLGNGKVFEGKAFGAQGDCVGEIVFTTNMCGYIETLTDPSYYGQIIMQTFPLIGNYGYISNDAESNGCYAKGYIVREWCDAPSNFRAQTDVDAFLKEKGIVGVCGVDTREITKIIREYGVMNARITTTLTDGIQDELKAYTIKDALKNVSSCAPSTLPAKGEKKHRVVLVDYGAKANIARCLNARGCEVVVVPYNTTAQQILALKPDGIMLSNGPGDPADNTECINELKNIIGKVPIFGICLGHQLLALAQGYSTTKLKYGHRGANQPVKDLKSGRVYITSQNHGYAVVADSIKDKDTVLRYINANDGTCEGLDYPRQGAFSVQFHPEGCAGPKDTEFLFDRFIANMGGNPNAD